MNGEIITGDCLEVMRNLETGSIDLVLTDLPYGVTQNQADKPLPLSRLWAEWERLLKARGNVILTSQMPYTVELIESKRDWFRYDLIWDKVLVSGYLNASRMPLRTHEQILVFYEKDGKYFPQKSLGVRSHSRGRGPRVANRNYGEHEEVDNGLRLGNFKHPTSIIVIQKPHPSIAKHPTEKPAELADYLIRSYSEQGDTVLDCCMGTGWTAVASANLGRNFVGIEISPEYAEIARARVRQHKEQTKLPESAAARESTG